LPFCFLNGIIGAIIIRRIVMERFQEEGVLKLDGSIENGLGFDAIKHEAMRVIEDNIDKPIAEWDDEAKLLLDSLYADHLIEELNYEKEQTLEGALREAYGRYAKDFDLQEEDIKDKRILDIGCGEGKFLLYCLEKGLTDDIYGIERNQEGIDKSDDWVNRDFKALREEYRDHFLNGDFVKDDISIDKLDHALARASLSLFSSEKEGEDIYKLVNKVEKCLKAGGDLRICPVFKDDRTDLYEKWQELARKVSMDTGMTYYFDNIEVRFPENYPDNERVSLRQSLTFKKEESKQSFGSKEDFEKKLGDESIEGVEILKKELGNMLRTHSFKDFCNALEMLKGRESLIYSEEMRRDALRGIKSSFSYIKGEMNQEEKKYLSVINELFGIEKEDIQDIVKNVLLEDLGARNFKDLILLAKEYEVDDFLSSEVIQEKADKSIMDALFWGYYNKAKRIKENLSIPEDVFMEKIKRAMDAGLEKGTGRMILLQKEFGLEREFFDSEEKREQLKRLFMDEVYQGDAFNVIEIRKNFPVDLEIGEEGEKEIKSLFLNVISKGNASSILSFKEQFSFIEDYIHSEEVVRVTQRAFLEAARTESFNTMCFLADNLDLDMKFFAEEEVQEVIEDVFYDCLVKDNGFDFAKNISEKFGLSDERVKTAGRDFLIHEIRNHDVKNAKAVQDYFELSGESLEEVIVEEISLILDSLGEDMIYEVGQIVREFGLSEESLVPLQKKAQGMANYYLYWNDLEAFDLVKKIFSLSQEFIDKEIREAVSQKLMDDSTDEYEMAIDIKRRFGGDELVKDPMVREAAEKAFMVALQGDLEYDYMYGGEPYDALVVKNEFNLSEEFIRNYIRGILIELITSDNPFNALKMKELFLKDISGEEVMSLDERTEAFFRELKSRDEDMYTKAEGNPGLALALLKHLGSGEDFYESLESYPFIKEVMDSNPKFGLKLFFKFDEFDETSKENISSLFSWKKQIMTENPEIDTGSQAFRVLMQKKVGNYMNNPETIAEMSRLIDTEEWLGYARKDDFILKNEEEASFSQMVKIPLVRMGQSISDYVRYIRDSLSDYSDELNQAVTYPEKYTDTVALVESIKERLKEEEGKEEKDEQKILGMRKGLAAHQENLDNLKKRAVGFWDRLESLSEKSTRLRETSKTLKDLEVRGDYSKEGKEKIGKAKEVLKRTFYDLRSGIESFRGGFREDLLSALGDKVGEEKVVGVVQELEEKVNETMNHLENDIQQLNDTFSEKQEKSPFAKNEMSVKLWNRDPDVDLYQGNYSPCCISIESGCGADSSESAISDYLTESAIQVVNVFDETRGIPVVAAWCWIGKDDQGESYFVVDNVEANTDYTKRYPKVLTLELTNYIKDYAKSVGIPESRIRKGINSNDLDLYISDIEKDISIVGKPNREGGYYLEAERVFEDQDW